jgi:carbon storage regulator
MLVLARKCGEAIVIAGRIKIQVICQKGKQVKLGIEAPDDVLIDRLEVAERRAALQLVGAVEEALAAPSQSRFSAPKFAKAPK